MNVISESLSSEVFAQNDGTSLYGFVTIERGHE